MRSTVAGWLENAMPSRDGREAADAILSYLAQPAQVAAE